MSHFTCLVIVKPDSENPEADAATLLAPYNENDEWFREGSRWDWWVVGGRWSGALTGYKPHMDPKWYRTCQYCQGTGTRSDMKSPYKEHHGDVCCPFPIIGEGCNVCHGTGQAMEFAGSIRSDSDIVRVSEIRENFVPFSFITPDGEWHEQARMGWFATTTDDKEKDAWTKEFLTAVQQYAPDHWAVLVDCHV